MKTPNAQTIASTHERDILTAAIEFLHGSSAPAAKAEELDLHPEASFRKNEVYGFLVVHPSGAYGVTAVLDGNTLHDWSCVALPL